MTMRAGRHLIEYWSETIAVYESLLEEAVERSWYSAEAYYRYQLDQYRKMLARIS